MTLQVAPGLTGDWLNGWLAAIGITVMLPQATLSWSDAPIPLARFEHPGPAALASAVAAAFPTEDQLASLALAPLKRNVSIETYRSAARASRKSGDHSLASSVTDLMTGKRFNPNDLPHGAFDPPAPRGTTLQSRVVLCRRLLGSAELEERVAQTLEGIGPRVRANGLGFDVRRLPAGVQPDAEVVVDPVVECLCFFAIRLFPVRGNGREARQRGWTASPSLPSSFVWPVWSQSLDAWGIDALLDGFPDRTRAAQLLGVTGAFASVPFQPSGTSDTTRGYGSAPVEVT